MKESHIVTLLRIVKVMLTRLAFTSLVFLFVPQIQASRDFTFGHLSIAQPFLTQEISAMADNQPLSPANSKKRKYRSIIETARQAWIEGNGKTFSELFVPSGQLIVPGQQWTGRDAIKTAIHDYNHTHSVVAIDIQSITIDENRAAIEWVWHDVERQTEHHTYADDAIIVTFHDGLIALWREYIDEKTPNAD